MKKILHVLWSGGFGGIERVVHDLAGFQASEQGLRVAVMIGHEGGPFGRKIGQKGIAVHVLGLGSGFDTAPAKLGRALRIMNRFQVLHLHDFVAPLALTAAVARGRVVYTEHGNFGFGRDVPLRERVKDGMKKQFLRLRAWSITANSRYTREIAERRYGLAGRIRVVHNGIDLSLNRPSRGRAETRRELGIAEDAFLVGTVARLAGFKRIDRLIRGFARTGPGARLAIVGDGPLRADLAALARKEGVAGAVLFTGFRDDVPDVIAAMDAFVLPSLGEPFGLAAVEAMALRVPVVVFADGGGLAEILVVAGSDLVARDEPHLAEILERIRSNGAATPPVPDYFSVRRMAEDLLQVYEGLPGRTE